MPATTKPGYFAQFLGTALPKPKLKTSLLAPLKSGGGSEIKYTHYSVFVHKVRRLPMMTAVNISGQAYAAITRAGDEPWDFSDQISEDYQTDNRFYGNDLNTFDRGHLVRRVDPCWGDVDVATQAEAETFRWVNCTPQHKKLNQMGGAWYQLEQHVMEHGVKNKLADVSVFAGPVLNPKDKVFTKTYLGKEYQVPTVFWKVIVWKKTDGKLYAVGFMMDQTEWIQSKLKEPAQPLETKKQLSALPDDYFENLKFNDNKTYQVRLDDIETATGITFDWPSVNRPFKGRTPKAVKAKPLKKVYTFGVYIKNKVALVAARKIVSAQTIEKAIAKRANVPLPPKEVKKRVRDGFGGVLRRYELTNISL